MELQEAKPTQHRLAGGMGLAHPTESGANSAQPLAEGKRQKFQLHSSGGAAEEPQGHVGSEIRRSNPIIVHMGKLSPREGGRIDQRRERQGSPRMRP